MIRSCQQVRKFRNVAALVVALLVAVASSNVWALSQKPMTTDEVIDASEQIFVAVCEGKSSQFRDGNIYTSYKLRPKEIWRGQLATNEDGVIEYEEMGGSAKGQILASQLPGASPTAEAPEVGISQYVGGAANMIIGEEVLLFTRTVRYQPGIVRQGMASGVPEGSLMIVGRTFGRFSVLTDPNSGEKYVTRIGVEGRGVVPSDAAVRGFLNTQQRQLATQSADPAANPAASGPSRGVPVGPLLEALGGSDDAAAAAIQRAKASRNRSANAIGALTGEIQDFDTLSEVKSRVEKRDEAKASK